MIKKRIFQVHHISYSPEITVKITKGEHFLLSHLSRHKYITEGFITALKVWVALNEGKAVKP